MKEPESAAAKGTGRGVEPRFFGLIKSLLLLLKKKINYCSTLSPLLLDINCLQLLQLERLRTIYRKC